jgi:hypothetical protein
MISKQKLVRFINKYYLNGTVGSTVFNSKTSNQQLSTRFVSGDKSLLGEVQMNKWEYEDADMGVYDTEQLLKLVSVLDDDIEFSINKTGNTAFSIELKDAYSAITYMLSDTSIIIELALKVTPQFISKFINGKSALPETDTFTIITDEVSSKTKLVIGYSAVNTHRVTIPVTTSKFENIDNISFNANLFKEVLIANKDCESAELQISSDGLAKINFKIDDFTSTYWLVAVSDVA